MEKRNQEKENKIPNKKGNNKEIGYCKPPKEHQIRPGEVRNPNGRPKNKKISDYITEEEREKYMNLLKEQATKDKKVLLFLTEQIFGKANQTIDSNVNVNESWGEFLNKLNGDNRKPSK